MPNRILKESITTSDTIDRLSAEEERFFYRLVVVADDFGRADARAAVLRAKCFPLKVDLELTAVESWLAACIREGLVRTYHSAGRRYLQIVTWRGHQNVRAKASKFPNPVAFDDEAPTPAHPPQASASDVIASASNCDQTPPDASVCGQPSADVPVLVLGSRISDLDPPTPQGGTPGGDAGEPERQARPPPSLTTPQSKPPRKPRRKPRPSKSAVVEATGDTAAVWRAYRAISPASVLTADRAELIRRWLRPVGPYTVEQLVECVEGYGVNPHHNGENETKTKYLKLELMLRDADHIEAGWGYLAKNRPGSRPAEPSGRLPDFKPRPADTGPPITDAERREAAEARQRLSRLTGGLAARASLPEPPPRTREAIEARRNLLREQAREASCQTT